VREALDRPGPALIEVMLDPEQEFEPRCRSKQLPDGTIVSPPPEDMYPFLDPEELAANTIRDD
jgi:acetolactate synthase-1/2/3 large subunit